LDNEPRARDESFGDSAAAIADFVPRYSVRLKGQGRFTGSGVMVFCRSDPPCVYILTAKHNLTILGKEYKLDVPDWNDAKAISALHAKFLETVTIPVGNRNARISNAFYFGRNWTYDVCCVTTSDEEVYGLWRNVGSQLEPLLWDDEDAAASARQSSLLALFAQDTQARTLSNANKNHLKNRYYLVQTGFGCSAYLAGPRTQAKINPDTQGNFDYRNLTVTDYWDTGHDYDDDAKKDNVFERMAAAGASEAATSAPGDSGGGVFALEKSSEKWLLAGVNLGANMHRDANNAIQKKAKAENNVFTVFDRERVLARSDLHTVLQGKIVDAKKDEAFESF
jgi:hypothetical protein